MSSDFYKQRHVKVKKAVTFTDLHLSSFRCFNPQCDKLRATEAPHGWLCDACQGRQLPLTPTQIGMAFAAQKRRDEIAAQQPLDAADLVVGGGIL